MATVTGLTAERMIAIEGASVIDGEVLGDHLILSKFDGTQIDAGNVRGPVGPTGPTGPPAVFPGEVSNLIIDNNLYFGVASDTRLYRTAANYLKTDGSFRTGAELRVFTDMVVNENNSGRVYFGSALDTSIYRSSSGNLKTDGNLLVGYSMMIDYANGGGKLYFGSANDTDLYRSAVSTLKTGSVFRSASYIFAYDGDALQLRLGNSSGYSAIEFGSAYDTRIYRSAANSLYTPGTLGTGLNLTSASDVIARSGSVYQVTTGYVSPGYPGIYFGYPGDSAIRRVGAGSIVSDGSLGVQVVAGYTIDSAGMVHATSFPTSSDDRLKKDIAQLDGVLDKLMKIRGVSFRWREDHGTHRDYTKDAHRERTDLQLGVVAQDVEKMFPELITEWPIFEEVTRVHEETGEEFFEQVETGETRMAVDYSRMIPVLIEAIRELDGRLKKAKI